jgi:hypothetical protein
MILVLPTDGLFEKHNPRASGMREKGSEAEVISYLSDYSSTKSWRDCSADVLAWPQ